MTAIVNVIMKLRPELAAAQMAAFSGLPAEIAAISRVATQLQTKEITNTANIPNRTESPMNTLLLVADDAEVLNSGFASRSYKIRIAHSGRFVKRKGEKKVNGR